MSGITAVTLKAIAREARRLAEETPDRKAGCLYVIHKDDDSMEANCIVGRALFNLGIPLTELDKRNTCSIKYLAGMAHGWEAEEWIDTSGEDALIYSNWLSDLQGHQDSGKTWGEALAFADRMLALREFNI